MKQATPLVRGLLLATAGLTLASTAAYAGLYPRAAPPGSAFVRVFNGTSAPAPAKVGDKTVPETQPMAASDYVFVEPGSVSASLAGKSESLTLDKSRCYTVAMTEEGAQSFDQDCFSSQLKSLLSVFNLIDGTTISVRMADGGAKVIDGVAGKSSGHREVNPAKATLAVFNGEQKIGDAKPVQLERGKVFSLFVTGTASDPRLTWVVN
jgi:alginate O-acetyltransferase complex protein AlgF